MLTLFFAVVLLALGLYFQSKPSFPKEKVSKWVNFYLFNFVLPALALLYIPQIDPGWELLLPISAAWFTFFCSWALFGSLGKILNWDNATTGCLIIVSGLANTSFLGFPVIEGLLGKEGLPTALLIDQGGSFLLVSSVSIIVASIYSHQQSSLSTIPLKIISFPPFLFLIATLCMSFLGWKTPEFILPLAAAIGKTMVPASIFAIGLRFRLDFESLNSKFFWLGMGYRLVLAPALVWLIYRNFNFEDELILHVTILESGMAPMITGSLVAIQYDLKPKLAALLSGLGIPISVVSILIWYFLLQ
ncbi:MAG: putative permease [Algoriphagus sp.]|jgi:predicted permease